MNDRPDLLALAVGIAVAVFGVSGLLNSTGVASHPGWIPPALVLATLAAAATARSIATLVRAPDRPTPDDADAP